MSRVVIPWAYSAMIFWSNPGKRRWYLAISAGSKRPWRSRRIASWSLPLSVSTAFGLTPLR